MRIHFAPSLIAMLLGSLKERAQSAGIRGGRSGAGVVALRFGA